MDPALASCLEGACNGNHPEDSATKAGTQRKAQPRKPTKKDAAKSGNDANAAPVDKAAADEEDDCGLQPSDGEFKDEEKLEKMLSDTKVRHGWRRLVRNFTPS